MCLGFDAAPLRTSFLKPTGSTVRSYINDSRRNVMKRITTSLAAAICAVAVSTPLAAVAFEKVSNKSDFMNIVEGKDLRLTGIKLNVMSDGEIVGRAFGAEVSGEWQWQGEYFCRTLYWGKRDLGQNCQEVSVQGDKIRFKSDRGAGRYADLTLR
jgi:hypothetical protein